MHPQLIDEIRRAVDAHMREATDIYRLAARECRDLTDAERERTDELVEAIEKDQYVIKRIKRTADHAFVNRIELMEGITL